MTERTRALMIERLDRVRAAIERDDDLVEVARVSGDLFPLVVDRRLAHACVEAAFTSHHQSNPDLEIEVTTQPFVRE